jgi:hypothetical protein
MILAYKRGASSNTPLKFMFSLSFNPPSAELAYIVNVPKGELEAAHSRPAASCRSQFRLFD